MDEDQLKIEDCNNGALVRFRRAGVRNWRNGLVLQVHLGDAPVLALATDEGEVDICQTQGDEIEILRKSSGRPRGRNRAGLAHG